MTHEHKHGAVVIALFVTIVVLTIAVVLYGILSIDQGLVSRVRLWWGLRENLEVPPPIDADIPVVSIPSESQWDEIRAKNSQKRSSRDNDL